MPCQTTSNFTKFWLITRPVPGHQRSHYYGELPVTLNTASTKWHYRTITEWRRCSGRQGALVVQQGYMALFRQALFRQALF